MSIFIRQELPKDYVETERVVEAAFKDEEMSDHQEHVLVERLRASDAFVPELSKVAVNEEEKIVGHVLLTKIQIQDGEQAIESLALAPVAVLPSQQNQGVGSRLIREALKEAATLGFRSVIVLGHPEYYPRFGFSKASEWKIRPPFEVPDEVFMAKELKEGALNGVSGVVEYSAPFNG